MSSNIDFNLQADPVPIVEIPEEAFFGLAAAVAVAATQYTVMQGENR